MRILPQSRLWRVIGSVALLVIIAGIAGLGWLVSASRKAAQDGRPPWRGAFPTLSVKAFADVRWRNLGWLNLRSQGPLLRTLTYNRRTIWPAASRMPADVSPDAILDAAMDPGLGVRELHRRGITGEGVNVAIIDQPLGGRHPEYAGKIAAYYDAGANTTRSMHGPAVVSLLVGARCGTAPGARLYYAAAPSWIGDVAYYYAQALDWIVEQNTRLPAHQKIRVVSVSTAPSGQGSPFTKNTERWDAACRRAEAASLLVLDCTPHHGFIDPCYYDAFDPDDVTKVKPGFPAFAWKWKSAGLLVPCSPRTAAEEYVAGLYEYQYCGQGGLSWSIPYCAGVLALGWQVRPDLTGPQMRELLFRSAYTTPAGDKIINPKAFIELVKQAPPGPAAL